VHLSQNNLGGSATHKLPPSIDLKSVEDTRILRRNKGYVLVRDNLYKRRSASGILMKYVRMEEGREIPQEIHEDVCGCDTQVISVVTP
jgi:hypothetical protein